MVIETPLCDVLKVVTKIYTPVPGFFVLIMNYSKYLLQLESMEGLQEFALSTLNDNNYYCQNISSILNLVAIMTI